MTSSQETIQTPITNKVEEKSSNPFISAMLLVLKIVQYVCLTAFVGATLVNITFPELPMAKIYAVAFVCLGGFLFFISQELGQNYGRIDEEALFRKKAEIYPGIMGDNFSGISSVVAARLKALKYCQELVDDYKRTRRNCRNIYYISQISTVVLSGVTPILVLVDKLEAGISWLKWLPVICPALAAIIASIVTSFPFQENWVAANKVVELLEAEQEKFVLGVSPLYQYDTFEDAQPAKKAQRAIENFIVQVNNIHLKQLESTQPKKQEQRTESATSGEAT